MKLNFIVEVHKLRQNYMGHWIKQLITKIAKIFLLQMEYYLIMKALLEGKFNQKNYKSIN